MIVKKYVWLNLATGEFSNSWSEADHIKHGEGIEEQAKMDFTWKLIAYECLNDEKFEFYNGMKIK
jgi:hypothetical protein